MVGYVGGNAPKERRTFFDQERVSRVAATVAAGLAAAVTALTTRVTTVEGKVTTVEGKVAATAWTAVTFTNSWYNYNGGWQTGQYRKVGDIASVRGLLGHPTAGADTTVFVLPVGFRPPANIMFTGQAYTVGNGYVKARINVYPDGQVGFDGSGHSPVLSGQVQYLSIDTISFSVTA